MWSHPLHTPSVSALWILPPPLLLPHPLLYWTGCPLWAGNPTERPGEGAPFSAALLGVRLFQFLLIALMCGAAGWVKGPPVLEGAGPGRGGPARVGTRKWWLCSSSRGWPGWDTLSAEIVQTGHCANTSLYVTSIV